MRIGSEAPRRRTHSLSLGSLAAVHRWSRRSKTPAVFEGGKGGVRAVIQPLRGT